LVSVLGPAGFVFSPGHTGTGSGGAFAAGEYRRDDRRLELHVRASLGLVRYHVGADSLSHEDFVRAVRFTTNIAEEPLYPGFSSDPLKAFQHLRVDIGRFGAAFLSGSSDELRALIRWVETHPKKVGFAALG
jgi:hypothetical protein